jgi:hypothetical protein
MGIALLEDGSGTINLDVPVSGRIDDPQFRLGKVIFKATMSMFGSIVTAPFSFLGAIFGGEQAPENVGLLEFEPGSAQLSPAHARKLGTVAQAMRERPRIDLEIAGYAGPGADAEALKQEKVRDFLRRSKRLELEKRGRAPDEDEKLEILPQEYDKYLRMAFERVTEKDAGDRSARKLEELLAQYAAVSDQELRELARRRGRNVRDHLMEQEGIEQDRIYMIEHDALAAPEKEGVSAARVDLGLNR